MYRLNFVLWRFRNILRLLMTYFLWYGVYTTNRMVYGYSRGDILTYVFMVLVVQTLVLSAPSSDNIGGEIGSGDLSNYLVKPVGYLKYWFTRDLASKLLNLMFAALEISGLFFLLKPPLVIPANLSVWISFLVLAGLATVTYYFLSTVTRFLAFWTPENTWGFSFLVIVFVEILAGGIFPLNMLPHWAYTALQFTPFPYLAYFPIAIFTGKIVGLEMIRIILQSMVWLGLMMAVTKYVWVKGLVVYQASGR